MSPLLIILLVWAGIAVLVIVTGMLLALYHSRRPRRYVTLRVIADDPSAGIEDEIERKAA